MDKKLKIFLEIAKVLNKHGIIPILFGSLGLYRIIDQVDEVNDIDIIIPNKNLIDQFDMFNKIMTEIGYKQDKTYPHEFTKGEIQIGFEPESDIEKLGINPAELQITSMENSKFRELTATDYLKVYKRNLETHNSKLKSIKRKIEVLEKC